jgi:membrane protein YdbS with pleckstrin-like domain
MNEIEAAVAVAPLSAAAPREFTLHPRTHDLWRWQALAWVLLFALPAVAIGAFGGKPLLALLVALLALLAVRLLWAWLRAYVARFRCRLLDDGLWIARGVLWRSETFVPRARVQHTDVNQGPLARRYGIATLKVFTAGTHHAEIDVAGLAHADALHLRDELLGRGGDDGV